MITLVAALLILWVWYAAGGETGDAELANDNSLLTFINDLPYSAGDDLSDRSLAGLEA